jgi:hypothetical protein
MAGAEALPMLDLEPEENWLRHRLRRLRTILRYAKEPRVESGLRELIADAEERAAKGATIKVRCGLSTKSCTFHRSRGYWAGALPFTEGNLRPAVVL